MKRWLLALCESAAPVAAVYCFDRMRLRLFGQQVLVLALLAVLAVFLIWPIVLTVRGGFVGPDGAFSLAPIRLVFADPSLRESLASSAMIAAVTTALAVAMSLPLAVVSARYAFAGKRLWNALVLVPLVLPPFVGAIGMKHILGRAGSLNALLGTELDVLGQGKFWGVVIVEALHLYPIVYLNVLSALANLDPTLDEAGRNLGAGGWLRFRRITLPLIRPGIFAGATIVFVWSFTELGTPLMFDMRHVLPVQVFYQLKEMESSAQPYALTVVMLVAAMLLYALGKGVFGSRGHTMYSKASIRSEERPLGLAGTLGAWLLFAAVIVPAMLPHVGVIAASFAAPGQWYHSMLPVQWTTDHYSDALGHSLAMGSIANSLKYATISMLLTLVIGTLIGYLIARGRVFGRGLLDALSMLPLAVPGMVLAFGYVAMTLAPPFSWGREAEGWRAWLAPLAERFDVLGPEANPLLLLVIAYAVRRLPYMVRSVTAGLEQTAVELEEAARNLGAGPLRTLSVITLPLIMANLIAGGLLVFSFSMLEVSDSLILAQREVHYPMTKAIYTLYQRLGDGEYIASAMGVWGMLLLIVTLTGASVLMGRKAGALFRV